VNYKTGASSYCSFYLIDTEYDMWNPVRSFKDRRKNYATRQFSHIRLE